MNCQEDPENITDKKIGEIFQDLEKPEAYIYIITKSRIYQFNPVIIFPLFEKYCRKSINTADVGIPHQFDGEDAEADWQRWQKRGDV